MEGRKAGSFNLDVLRSSSPARMQAKDEGRQDAQRDRHNCSLLCAQTLATLVAQEAAAEMAAVLCAQLSSLRISAQRVSTLEAVRIQFSPLHVSRSGWTARQRAALNLERPGLGQT